MISFAPLHPRDFGPLLANMREIDKRECALAGITPKKALRFGLLNGEATTVFDDGRQIAAFGVVPGTILTGTGVVWMITTDEAANRPREWLVYGRHWVEALRSRWPHLKNRVHRDNRLAIRWLTRIGFTVEPEDPDSEFRHFRLCANQ